MSKTSKARAKRTQSSGDLRTEYRFDYAKAQPNRFAEPASRLSDRDEPLPSYEDVLFSLVADIARGRCLPIVGAGFSQSATLPPGMTMPDWAGLSSILALPAGVAPDASLPVVAQRFEEKFGRVQLIETIRDALKFDKARPGRAHRALARLPFDTIFTTSFDVLLEAAYEAEGRPVRSVAGKLELPDHVGETASDIVKMHGDLRHEEHMILTQNDYDKFLLKYPVVATQFAAMLITRTPLFIGYSLSDPDFNGLCRIINSRLGGLEGIGYVLQFSGASETTEIAFKHKLRIISFPGFGRRLDEALADFFDRIQGQLDTSTSIALRSYRPDVFEVLDPDVFQAAVTSADGVIEATSRLCVVMMPAGKKSDEVYRNVIAPAVATHGLTTLRPDEISLRGFIVEHIRAAIQQSRICIADLTGNDPNVLYEIGLANSLKKPLVFLAEENAHLPFDIAHHPIVFYGQDLNKSEEDLRRAVGVATANRATDAIRLLELGCHRASIASAALVLEMRLRCLLSGEPPRQLARMSMEQMLQILRERGLINPEQAKRLSEVVSMRNRAVHAERDQAQPSRTEAELAVAAIQDFLNDNPAPECGDMNL